MCNTCKGDGVIEVMCETCDGAGDIESCISGLNLYSVRCTGEEMQALETLQDDARRVQKQAEQLIAINPAYAARYRQQLNETLERINAEATHILKP